MKILILATAFNGLCQRIHRELSLMGHIVSVELAISDTHMIEAVTMFNPDLVVCPYLKERIPTSIWEKYVCLIVHPGIAGDRGPSALDWAIRTNVPHWGVTVIQASEEMDAGNIWGTEEFTVRETSKASLYRREVAKYATKLIKDAVKNFQSGNYQTRSLNYDDPDIRGRLQPLIRHSDRKIDWSRDSTDEVVQKINSADSYPGLLDSLLGEQVYLFGVKRAESLSGEPGKLIARSNGSLCRATVDGAVWIRMAKRIEGPERQKVKLPASQVFDLIRGSKPLKSKLPAGNGNAHDDIHWFEHNKAAYLYFDFYNGAMDTHQCRRLTATLKEIKRRPVNIIVLMGGEDFWGNGIQLNCIEAAADPARAAWENINAMDDLVLEIIDTPKQITVAALRNNAGAGGAIMPLACDKILLRDGVVLNPHYGLMGLHGSEYWTYLLPKRVGEVQAGIIMRECAPMLTKEAILVGFGDELLDEEWSHYHTALQQHVENMALSKALKQFLKEKKLDRKKDEKTKRLAQYRKEELKHMHEAFFDPNSEFHIRRCRFVHKHPLTETSCSLALHRMGDNGKWNVSISHNESVVVN